MDIRTNPTKNQRGETLKKYQDYTKWELLKVIKSIDNIIQELDGQVYYYMQRKKHYKEVQEKYYKKLKEFEVE